MKANRDKLLDHLTDLQLRPVTNGLHQIRYWSALDDPSEEKWDYTSHISRVDRRYPDRARRSDFDLDDDESSSRSSGSGRARPYLIVTLIVLVVAALGVSGFFLWTDYISPSLDKAAFTESEYAPIQGYLVQVGAREIGVVSEQDRAAVEACVADLQQQAQALAGGPVQAEQELQFTPVTVDVIYVPDVSDVNAIISRHMVFTPVQTTAPEIPSDVPVDTPADTAEEPGENGDAETAPEGEDGSVG